AAPFPSTCGSGASWPSACRARGARGARRRRRLDMARLGPAPVCHSDLFDELTICRDVSEAPGEEEGQEGDAGPSVCGPGCGALLARSLELLAMDVQLLPPALDVALRLTPSWWRRVYRVGRLMPSSRATRVRFPLC